MMLKEKPHRAEVQLTCFKAQYVVQIEPTIIPLPTNHMGGSRGGQGVRIPPPPPREKS